MTKPTILSRCGKLAEAGAREHDGVAHATHGAVALTVHANRTHGHLAQVVAVRPVDLSTPDALACYLDGVARSCRKLANACRRGVNIPLEDWRAAGVEPGDTTTDNDAHDTTDTTTPEASA